MIFDLYDWFYNIIAGLSMFDFYRCELYFDYSNNWSFHFSYLSDFLCILLIWVPAVQVWSFLLKSVIFCLQVWILWVPDVLNDRFLVVWLIFDLNDWLCLSSSYYFLCFRQNSHFLSLQIIQNAFISSLVCFVSWWYFWEHLSYIWYPYRFFSLI